MAPRTDHSLPTRWEDSSVKGIVRVTPKGQPSVFDIIKVLGGQKNPRDAWDCITKVHPEVVGKCDNFQFPGRGQRKTPVARTNEQH